MSGDGRSGRPQEERLATDPNDVDNKVSAASQPTLTLAALSALYAVPLRRYFERRLRDRSEAPDLVQDVFLRMSRMGNVAELREPGKYLFAAARSALNDKFRREQVRQRDSHEPFDETQHQSSAFAPDCVLERSEVVRLIQNALTDLPQRTRDVFVLRVFEGYRMADIASTLGISQRATEKHAARSLAHVAAALKDYRRA